MSTPPPLPPPRTDPLQELRALEAAHLPLLQALFQQPGNAAVRTQLQAQNALIDAARTRLAAHLKPNHMQRPARGKVAP